MPQCKKCSNFFPPNYTDIIPDREPDDSGQYPQHCVFCRDGVDFVMREETANSNKFTVKYTKGECISDYKKFVDKMKKVSDKEQLKKLMKENPFGLD